MLPRPQAGSSRSRSPDSAPAGPPTSPTLRLRITHITSTVSPPLAHLRTLYIPPTLPTAVPPGNLPHQLPVVRIFGTTPASQKICANVHLCYPYFYVPFPMDSADPLRPERVVKLCQRFAVSLNHAICLGLRQNPAAKAGTDDKHLHVVSVMLVKGTPFYGYHVGNSYFLKISLANPSRMHVALEQLRKPVVLGREWQPHEAHISHVLQFMCDFDLYGCGWLDLDGAMFREPLPEGDPYDLQPSMINTLTVPTDMLYPSAMSPPRDTFAPLEVDVLPQDILNRRRLRPRLLHHDFVELRHPLDPEEKLVPAMRELWEDERRRRMQRGLGTAEAAMLPVSDGERGRTMDELGYNGVHNNGGYWKISGEYWRMLEAKMANERKRRGPLSFERFSRDIAAGVNNEKRIYDKSASPEPLSETFDPDQSIEPILDKLQAVQTQPRPPSNISDSAWTINLPPPSKQSVLNTFGVHNLPSVVYQQPYYSQAVDVPPRAKHFVGRMFTVKGSRVIDTPNFEHLVGLVHTPTDLTSQLAHPTQKSKYGFKYSQQQKTRKPEREQQNMSVMSLEVFGTDVMEELSRVVSGYSSHRKDFYSATHTSTFKVSGRHVLNLWRILRSEVNLTQYTFENVAFHVLHQRIPRYSASVLTALWKSVTHEHRVRVLKYMIQRVVICAEIIDAAEVITKNAEFARVFGVDFASVMFRGSQFKVESFMFRIAKPENFVLVSPSKHQVGLQNAPFAVPLIAEPESKFHTDPIVVLDFQSLYPSIMIAYNICYSTCLGRVENFKGINKFGFTDLRVAEGLLELLKDYLTVTPNGMIFVKPAVRKSLLAKMLGEILDTRVMVKHAMKLAKGNKPLTRLLNARQLCLKLMANVTYGYTSATFSGRMPCIEIADSIVQTGRETLEKAQELIQSRRDWDAQVVYGDTDSLFIALPGRSKEQAFKIGHHIADTITALNPKPVKLKFEKVYMGSILMAKKRYVGFKYEHPDEDEPVFDAKGIETIRRDGFPAQQKMEEVCLKLLFRTQDLSQVKEFCREEWSKILQGRVSLQDFIIAKEVRLGSYSDTGVPPPGAAVAYRRILKDPRDEPQYADRVPYIVSNADGRRIIDRARTPEEMLGNRSLGIDAEYYIKNLLIPPLSRIFNLVGADVEQWYETMPRTKRAAKYDDANHHIDAHFRSRHCVVCGAPSKEDICDDCRRNPAIATHTLHARDHMVQARLRAYQAICSSCSATPVAERILCDSIDCPVTYVRVQGQRDAEESAITKALLEGMNQEDEAMDHDSDW
ncbi:DNA polymerase zeta [Cryptotrichosporon argae]